LTAHAVILASLPSFNATEPSGRIRRSRFYRLGAAAEFVSLLVNDILPAIVADLQNWMDCRLDTVRQLHGTRTRLQYSKVGLDGPRRPIGHLDE
jgi:hypothetical protein